MDGEAKFSCVGKISGVHGLRGWLKIKSFTEPEQNVFEYTPWRVKLQGQWQELEVERAQPHKGGWIARIVGVDDRTAAEAYKLIDIYVDQNQFAALEEGEFYWHELVGMRVQAEQDGGENPLDIGVVKQLLETGANDVLVIQADASSVDNKERLIPYVPDVYVKDVDLETRVLVVSWDLSWDADD
ncbi:ribosome maturation factor RimM [Agaribacterium haliotis]|uniref:ribosome maturation factor RimM n=1 Tax=Agaribacterium haliotis TaxID=2013869 RepID=UPI000BB561AD|nr:ribosome maturation factor RimM [Agaribacterium haliotis]